MMTATLSLAVARSMTGHPSLAADAECVSGDATSEPDFPTRPPERGRPQGESR